MKRRAIEDLSLPGVLSRIVSGFAGTCGLADLELTKARFISKDSEHLILRKQWEGVGGPRILLLKASTFTPPLTPAQQAEGWFEDTDRVTRTTAFADTLDPMPAGEVRCYRELQSHALTSSSSKMCASYIVVHAVAAVEFGGFPGVHMTLRLFSYPPTIAELRNADDELSEFAQVEGCSHTAFTITPFLTTTRSSGRLCAQLRGVRKLLPRSHRRHP